MSRSLNQRNASRSDHDLLRPPVHIRALRIFLFLILTLSADHSRAGAVSYNFDRPPPPWLPDLILVIPVDRNFLLFRPDKFSLFKRDNHFSPPERPFPAFSAGLYPVKGNGFLPPVLSALEIEKRVNIVGIGITGTLRLPVLRRNNWTISLNGSISSAYYNLETHQQKNRWSFEHQFGGDASYHFNNFLRFSLGVRHYRIINDFQHDNPAKSYIKSNGGIMSLRFQY